MSKADIVMKITQAIFVLIGLAFFTAVVGFLLLLSGANHYITLLIMVSFILFITFIFIQQKTPTSTGGEMNAAIALIQRVFKHPLNQDKSLWRMSRIWKRSFSSALEKIRTQLRRGVIDLFSV